MKQNPSGFSVLLFIGTILAVSCSSPKTESNQTAVNKNSNAAVSNASPTNSNQSNQSGTGTIEVTSVPPGARVLLISNDESGAGEPQSKGLTPTTITGVQPGKYTVDLERSGYRFFQKDVTVKAGSTVKVVGNLKKQ